MENAFTAALLSVSGIGQERVKSLIRYFSSARQAWQADRRDLFMCGSLSEAIIDQLLKVRQKVDPVLQLEIWHQRGIQVVSLAETHYPHLLKTIYNPPELLFYRGIMPSHDNLIGIVGTRRASAYGRNAANSLATALAASGFWVVSGAARGIDTAAHLGALEQGNTIAVLGCGVDISYPPENRQLLNRITAAGAVLSEYSPGTPPTPGLFPARNRLISGLARGVVIIEAGEKSGALITADAALEQNRDVFAVPGSIFSEQSRGTHALIKQGAKLVDCVDAILEEYQVEYIGKKGIPPMGPDESAVYNALSADRPSSLEEIVIRTNLSVANVSYILLQFELQGMAQADGQRYVQRAREVNR